MVVQAMKIVLENELGAKTPTHFCNNKTLAHEHLFGYNRVTMLEVAMHVDKYFSLLLNIAR